MEGGKGEKLNIDCTDDSIACIFVVWGHALRREGAGPQTIVRQLLGRESVSRESATSLHSSGVLKSIEKCLKSLSTTSSVVPVP